MTRVALVLAALLPLLVLPVSEAQPSPPSLAEREAAQAADLEERLLGANRPVERVLDRDPELERAIRRLKRARLDRVAEGFGWSPPRGRGHRFGNDVTEPFALIGVDAQRRVAINYRYRDAEQVMVQLALGKQQRESAGLVGDTPVLLWADPSLSAEHVWALAWMAAPFASEIRLVVTPGRVELPRVSPELQRRFDECLEQVAIGFSLECYFSLIPLALEGCEDEVRLFHDLLPTKLYDLVVDPSLLFDRCGARPLVAPRRFEAIWRFLIDFAYPLDTEYLLIDLEQPPPRSARTVQQWARHLMHEQLD